MIVEIEGYLMQQVDSFIFCLSKVDKMGLL
jgi:hypothetical protein